VSRCLRENRLREGEGLCAEEKGSRFNREEDGPGGGSGLVREMEGKTCPAEGRRNRKSKASPSARGFSGLLCQGERGGRPLVFAKGKWAADQFQEQKISKKMGVAPFQKDQSWGLLGFFFCVLFCSPKIFSTPQKCSPWVSKFFLLPLFHYSMIFTEEIFLGFQLVPQLFFFFFVLFSFFFILIFFIFFVFFKANNINVDSKNQWL
jgi:hypothetical protein